MDRTTWETSSSRRMNGVATGAITALWLTPRFGRALARRKAVLKTPPFAVDEEHDGWQPIRSRDRPLLVIAIEDARRLKRGG